MKGVLTGMDRSSLKLGDEIFSNGETTPICEPRAIALLIMEMQRKLFGSSDLII